MASEWHASLRNVDLAKVALCIIAGGTLANAMFNAVMNALGHGYPYTTFLFIPGDRWSDFFKLAFAYPIGSVHPNTILFMADHIDTMKAIANELRGTAINPDHMLPLATLLALLVRLGMTVASPIAIFAACLGVAAAIYVTMIKAMVVDPAQRSAWRAAGLLSYPALFMADRGHMFAFLCAVTLMPACWRMVRDRKLDMVSIALLATAANLRPNVLIVPAILFLALGLGRWRDCVRLGAVGLCLLLSTFVLANAVYPHYNLGSWMAGMEDYRRLYVEHPLSPGFTSSLPSALNLLFGYQPVFGRISLAFAASIAVVACNLARQGMLNDAGVLFVALAVMLIGLPAMGDYHLLPFLLPPMILASNGQPLSRGDLIVFAASTFLLIPKNYLYGSDLGSDVWSWQVVANPLVASLASMYVLIRASRWRGVTNLSQIRDICFSPRSDQLAVRAERSSTLFTQFRAGTSIKR